MRHRHLSWLLSSLLVVGGGWVGAEASTRLLRHPDISQRHVVFAYANDIWIAGHDGADPRRLTTFPGQETRPHFSPDGRTIAFSGQYDGNTDVYTLSIDGGEPRRLTFHPAADTVVGWSADGESVIFRSGRFSAPVGYGKLFRVSQQGGMPSQDPVPRFWDGHYDAREARLAYAPIQPSDIEWRNYRGGQARPIWLLQMRDHGLTRLPWEGSRDTDPVWVGDDIYFLSDRDLAVNVWRYDAGSGQLDQVTRFKEFDCKNLESGAGKLIFENGGRLHLLDPAAGATPRRLDVEIKADLPWVRPHWESVGDQLGSPVLSPTGKRALFEARGEIFTIPVDDGNWRNLTRSPGVADRSPAWSPDGAWIAWFSDAEGEYALMIASQDGLAEPRRIELQNPSFYQTPAWSPDSKKLLFTNHARVLFYVDVESGKQLRVDADEYAHPSRTLNPTWSPDSNWIAYSKRLDNQFHAIMVYSLEQKRVFQLTDGLSDAVSPAWDEGGKFLWFLASTNYALNVGWLDMSNYPHSVEREVYLAVLQDDEPSPLLPKSDEEAVSEEAADDGAKGDPSDASAEDGAKEELTIEIDWEGISQRILSIDAPSRSYVGLFSGAEGVIYYAETIPNQPGITLHRYSLEDREAKKFLEGASAATVSANGEKLLYQSGGSWFVVGAAAPPQAGKGRLDTDVRMKVDPRAEWRQIFREAWRYQRDYFYVRNIHGADWDWTYRTYAPWVEDVGHRSDLTHLLDILGGETAVGHSFTFGGDTPDVQQVQVGLLGADLEIDRGRYRLSRIYNGENWNPELRAPLSAPGIVAEVGDYLVAVNGVELTADVNPYAPFEGTAGRQTVIQLNDKPSLAGAREVTVVPVSSEQGLRRRAWVEDNRRKVDEMSDGKLAYVWLPNTALGGYTYFNRYYFAQQDKQGAVIDERFNGGGSAADYIVDLLDRELQGFFNNPIGRQKPFTNPNAGIWGPKVMVINESAGSGGDLLPWMFRNMGIGPLIGTTTWGGLVGIWDVPGLIDGGAITAPRGGFYDNNGEWAVENEGVAPDIEVEQTPKEVVAGADPQLERAVREALRLLAEYDGQPVLPQPPDPVRAVRPR